MRHRAHMSHSGVLLLVMVGMFVQPHCSEQRRLQAKALVMVGMFVQPHCDLAQGWLPVSIYIVVVLRYW